MYDSEVRNLLMVLPPCPKCKKLSVEYCRNGNLRCPDCGFTVYALPDDTLQERAVAWRMGKSRKEHWIKPKPPVLTEADYQAGEEIWWHEGVPAPFSRENWRKRQEAAFNYLLAQRDKAVYAVGPNELKQHATQVKKISDWFNGGVHD